MEKHNEYNKYPNKYASPAPYDISKCMECGKPTKQIGYEWHGILCKKCFCKAYYELIQDSKKTVKECYKFYIGKS